MKNTLPSDMAQPAASAERFVLLDALRGLALFGICLANFPEFSLYTFLPGDVAATLPGAAFDRTIRLAQYALIDGKFYTIFSVLFGMGFSMIIANAARKGADGFSLFYRRMAILLTIGLAHLLLVWSGDILALYALLGLLLPSFRNASDKTLCLLAAVLLLLPVGIDAALETTGFDPSAPVVGLQKRFCAQYGITDANFAFWLRDARSYGDVFHFLVQGAFERLQEFIDGNRVFKVTGLFLLGFSIGRNRLYAEPEKAKPLFRKVSLYGFALGLPASLVYAWSSTNGHPWGEAVHALWYALGVFPLGLAYMAAFGLWYFKSPRNRFFLTLAASGRMALTNYLGQSVCGVAIFYGIGLSWGASVNLAGVLALATAVFLAETAFSRAWLHYFRFGPAEWLWRMLTYKKRLSLLKHRS